ncbi:MAG TPA: hypothetical protein VKM56_11820 [Verrucomicrobiae bacterium]|nr:hypothetical protein [Verrucomicrobiae bacterium]
MRAAVWVWLLLLLSLASASGQVVINEALVNPPATDAPNQYIELRGPPNQILTLGTYFVAVEGDTNGNPGTIQDVFDLSGKAIGGNGFLVLLQKTNSYVAAIGSTVLVNTGKGAGWGSGSSSSIGHRGENGQTDLEHGSFTLFLIQAPTAPAIGADIDSDNDGTPDGPVFASWTIFDSVGVLDDSGVGDIAYGAINFRRNSAATASGVVVPVSFNPDYVGRAGNTTGSAAASWVASASLGGTAPNWTLGSSGNTVPATAGGVALNHIGAPNFGAAALPGVMAIQSGGSTDVLEGDGTDSYTLMLNTAPTGPVTVQIDAPGQLQISTDGGASFGASRTVVLNSSVGQTVTVRALADDVIDTSPHVLAIQHRISATADATHYPMTALMPVVNVNVTEQDYALLSELKGNPPGPDDPFEFVEIRGPPNFLLTNIYFVVVEGDVGGNPGTAAAVINLTSARIGSSGLLLLLGSGSPYSVPAGTTVMIDPHFNIAGGALGNGSVSFLLVSSPAAIVEGVDLDAGDNGILEGLPAGSFIMDSVGWLDGNNINDVAYGGAILTEVSGAPDAATRFAWNNTPRSADAWFCGKLDGTNGSAVAFNEKNVSANFPFGTLLTPGFIGNSPPSARNLSPICGVIGDPHNPVITFRLVDANNAPDELKVSATSSNWLVVPDSALTLTALANGWYTLALEPIAVGYSLITIRVTDGELTGLPSFLYAASAMGRPGGSFHIGASDGSTAIPIDSHWMLIGDDENEVLRLYDRTQSGYPVREFDITPFLGLTDYYDNGTPREIDIEASTRVGNRLFWIGSHSHSSTGETRTNRSRIFAVDMTGTGTNINLTYVGRYDYLKLDLVNWDVNNGHGKGANYYGLFDSTEEGVDPKGTNGFNIEGLSMIAGSSSAALVGLRAPIVPVTNRTYALIVPVLNFAALAVSGGPPGSAQFGPPIELDLYGRGVRSMEGSINGYMIVGGSPLNGPDHYPLDSRLYTWSGDRSQNAQQRAADLKGLNPEGIVELPAPPWTSSSIVQLVSDNGTKVYYGDGIEAKHLPEPNFKKCRSDFVALGDIVKPAPIITRTELSDSGVTITWRSLKGEAYRVQFSTMLEPDDWIDLVPDILATGPYSSFTDYEFLTEGFYRVLLVQ